jgi:hypothetical protein
MEAEICGCIGLASTRKTEYAEAPPSIDVQGTRSEGVRGAARAVMQ